MAPAHPALASSSPLSERASLWSSSDDAPDSPSATSPVVASSSSAADGPALKTGLGCALVVCAVFALVAGLVFYLVRRSMRRTQVVVVASDSCRRESCETIKSFVQFGMGVDEPKAMTLEIDWIRFSVVSDVGPRTSCDTIIAFPDVAYLSRKYSMEDDRSSLDGTLVGFGSRCSSISSCMVLDLHPSFQR